MEDEQCQKYWIFMDSHNLQLNLRLTLILNVKLTLGISTPIKVSVDSQNQIILSIRIKWTDVCQIVMCNQSQYGIFEWSISTIQSIILLPGAIILW